MTEDNENLRAENRRLREKVERLEHERAWWERRYRVQHRKLHYLEEELADARLALADARPPDRG